MKQRINHRYRIMAYTGFFGLLAVAVAFMAFSPISPPSANPFLGKEMFVDPNSSAVKQVAEWRTIRPADAQLIEKIAKEPQAKWFGDWNKDIYQEVDAYVTFVTNEQKLPLLVAYNIPLRDCGSYSKGGAKSPDEYREWINDFTRGIGGREAVVILEPDAVTGASCLAEKDKDQRYELLGYGLERLITSTSTYVYIDAGNPSWMPAKEVAERLKLVGIKQAQGFALNVSYFSTDNENIVYGQELGKLLGGKNFVINTSRSGAGPTVDHAWCNPPDRALGTPPATVTDIPYLDAYLWIKLPGESDGLCNDGPMAGAWWPEYALELARNAVH